MSVSSFCCAVSILPAMGQPRRQVVSLYLTLDLALFKESARKIKIRIKNLARGIAGFVLVPTASAAVSCCPACKGSFRSITPNGTTGLGSCRAALGVFELGPLGHTTEKNIYE